MDRYEDQDIILYIKGGILYAKYKRGCIVTKEIGDKVISERIKLCNGVSYPVIADISGVKYWTMSSRNNDMKEHAFDLISCTALIIKSKLVKIVWDFTISLFPLPVPNKRFQTIHAAEKWIVSRIK